MKKILVVSLFLFTRLFFGQDLSDKDIINKAVEFLKVKEKDLLSDKICLKVIPNQKEKVIILVPVISKRYSECGDDPCFDIDNNILVWNKSTKSIETKYTKKAEWSSDAMQFDELKIDTGLYYLNKSARAFGIRYNYIVSSNDPYGSVAINLYYLKNNRIIEVLNNFELEMYNGERGSDPCNASYETSKSVFIFSEKLSEKFNDISVKTKFKDYSTNASDCEKEIIKKESTKNSVLKFDEKQHKYVLKQ